MCFIRDLNFLIHLIVLLLFVLQRIDAECETNPEKVKQKFLESFQSVSFTNRLKAVKILSIQLL